jgi:hypothetical protein
MPVGWGSFDSSTFASVTKTAAMPIGTFTKKIHSQPSPSVSAPPTSGPIATAAPTVAPQMPNAVARSRPWKAWAINDSEVANSIAPPMPWTPRERISISGDTARPHAAEAAENRTRPRTKTARRPIRSDNEPETSSSAARVSA